MHLDGEIRIFYEWRIARIVGTDNGRKIRDTLVVKEGGL